MNFSETPFKGVYIIEPTSNKDHRGEFYRTFCRKEFEKFGITNDWVQMNHVSNNSKGTVRGMHFQVFPGKDSKLVRCIQGSVMDIIVDIRKNSSTYLKSYSIELSQKNKKMLFIPEGFAHGYQTLEDNTDLVYCHSAYYSPELESGVRFNDPALNLYWPFVVTEVSEKDKNHPLITNDFNGI